MNRPAVLAHEENFDPGSVGGPMPTEPALIRTELEEKNGVTTLVVTMLFASKEAREAAVSTGMTDGMEVGYARLDAAFEAKAA